MAVAIGMVVFLVAWVAVASHLLGKVTPPARSLPPELLAGFMHDRLTRVEGTGTVEMTTDAEIPVRAEP